MEHLHRHFHEMHDKRDVTTENGVVMSVVYVTASPSFDGVIGGYTTLDGASPTAAQTSQAQAAATSAAAAASASTQAQSSYVAPVASTASSAVASSIVASSAILSSVNQLTSAASSFATATSAVTSFESASNTEVSGASATSSSDSSSSHSSGGMSTGAKAGLAIGIIAIIGIVAALLLWFIGKKKRDQNEHNRADNEKATFGASPNAVPMTTTSSQSPAKAPRLSLRPMSEMMGFMGGHKNRTSKGNMLNDINEGGVRNNRNLTPSPQNLSRAASPLYNEKPENPFADPQNPFADPVRSPVPPMNVERFTPATPAPNRPPVDRKPMPFNAPSPAPTPVTLASSATLPSSSPGPMPTAAGAAVGLAAAGAVAGGSKAMSRKPEPVPEPESEVTSSPRPDSDTVTPLVAAAGAVATPRSPAPSQDGVQENVQGNVYRVLMDFAPSMDDELELKTGQLVRLLHAYDDGWAMCIKLDRSSQGVVPRTCLAAKPSKPKPSHLNQYARSGPQGRPMSPAGMRGRPESPAGMPPRSMSPMGMPPRSMSPAGMPPRSMSPAGGPRMPNGGRSMSPAMQDRSMSPMGAPARPFSPSMQRPMSPQGFGGRSASPAGRGPPQGSMRPLSPGAYNRLGAPRPLSPGPPRQHRRSQSGGLAPPRAVKSRPRSNSASAMNVRDRRASPPGPSNLSNAPAIPGMAF